MTMFILIPSLTNACRVWLWTLHIISSHRKECNRRATTTTWSSRNINSSNSSNNNREQYTDPMAICQMYASRRSTCRTAINFKTLFQIPQANLSGYRSPQCRPSPGSSPNLIGALTNSSGDNSNPSAPCSPSPAQAASPGNNGWAIGHFTRTLAFLSYSSLSFQAKCNWGQQLRGPIHK